MEFLKITEDDLEQILRWRTSEFVTRFMYTDMEYNLENQYKWFQKISAVDSAKYWILSLKGKKFGLVSLNDIQPHHRRASWAFYVGEPSMSMAAGLIGPHLYNYAFYRLGLNKLYGEVMAENEAVRRMHLQNGCREVGFFQEHIYKYGKFHDVYVYEMTANRWKEVGKKYKRFMPQVEE